MAGNSGSVYPSSQFGQEVLRAHIPCFAGSDIVAGAPVCIASGADWSVVHCLTSQAKPIGIAKDYAAAGDPVSVYDDGNIKRVAGAGGSFPREAYVGVVGTSSVSHPISKVSVTYGVVGQVAGTPSIPVGASATPVWALGVAYESAALNDQAAVRIEPRLLTGLVSS